LICTLYTRQALTGEILPKLALFLHPRSTYLSINDPRASYLPNPVITVCAKVAQRTALFFFLFLQVFLSSDNMITRCSLFPISILAIMNLADVYGGVLLRSHQNSVANSNPPYTLDIPHPYSFPQEMPYSPYTMYTHVPEPEPEPEPEPAHPSHKCEPNPQQSQTESNHLRESRLQRTDQPESNPQRKLRNETHSPSDHNSEPHFQSNQNHTLNHLSHDDYQDPLPHPVPHRHVRKFRVRMPSRTYAFKREADLHLP